MKTSAATAREQDGSQGHLLRVFNTRQLSSAERDKLVVIARKVDSELVATTLYADMVWQLPAPTTTAIKARCKLDFHTIPICFIAVAKSIMYRLIHHGRDRHRRSGTSTTVKIFDGMKPFFHYLKMLQFEQLSHVTPLVCYQYLEACRTKKSNGKVESAQFLTPATLYRRLSAVEAVYELSQYSDEPMAAHPWPDTSADMLSHYGRSKRIDRNQTPLMSDEVFEKIFQRAWSIVQKADYLIDLRELVGMTVPPTLDVSIFHFSQLKNAALVKNNWHKGGKAFRAELQNIRTACYVVIACLTGCRNHEIGFLRRDCYYRTEVEGEQYWWMRSISTKTGAGSTDWMIPEAAVEALRIMDRWVKPFQEMLRKEIQRHRILNSTDVRIAEAQEHLDAIFVGVNFKQDNQVRVLSAQALNSYLKEFAKSCGVDWPLATHHFRRKFANYAARSQFGDLRYLKEHFKHWSMDMTLHYALNDHQEMALYLEVEDELDGIRSRIAGTWLDADESLGGGYGERMMRWRSRRDTVTLFKDHAHMVRAVAQSTAIRSNGHAWCTADDGQCIGNNLEPTRCAGGCPNAVIGSEHAPVYQGLYQHLKTLEHADDIGEGGRARVIRDLDRCRKVFTALGCDPLTVSS